jgi:8-oxo-dGTP diphosphatase
VTGARMLKVVNVVGAVILRNGLVLCAQRGPNGSLPGLWEFPGGKVELGESKVDALHREIQEELSVELLVGHELDCSTYEYDFAAVTLTTFWCSLSAGEPAKSEHSELRWLSPRELHTLEWAPADIPAVTKIRAVL